MQTVFSGQVQPVVLKEIHIQVHCVLIKANRQIVH